MIKTTVCVMDTTLVKVKNLKIHPRQSSEDVILNLIKFYKNHQNMINDSVEYMLKNNVKEEFIVEGGIVNGR